MNKPRKEAALKAISPMQADGCTIDQIKEALEASDKKYTPAEVEEILAAMVDATTNDKEGDEQDKQDKTPAKKPEQKKEPEKVTFDKLLCRDRNITNDKEGDVEKPKNEWWELKVIENKRKGIKISQRNADELNSQAHNTLLFYGQSGKVKVGDTIIIKIPKGKTFEVHEIIKNQD